MTLAEQIAIYKAQETEVYLYELPELLDHLIKLHEHEMPYGVLTADEQTPDEWLEEMIFAGEIVL